MENNTKAVEFVKGVFGGTCLSPQVMLGVAPHSGFLIAETGGAGGKYMLYTYTLQGTHINVLQEFGAGVELPVETLIHLVSTFYNYILSPVCYNLEESTVQVRIKYYWEKPCAFEAFAS